MILLYVILTSILCVISVACVYLEIQRKKFNKKFGHIPGPKQYPVIGNLYGVHSSNATDFNGYVDVLTKAPVVKMVVPGCIIFGISDPNIAAQVLNSSAFLGRVKYFLKFTPWNEAMMTSACPIEWRFLRKMTQRAFAHKHLLSMIPTFNKHLEKFYEKLKTPADSGSLVNLYELTCEIGMEEALETILNCDGTNLSLLADMFKQMVDNICKRIVYLPYHSNYIYQYTKDHQQSMDIFNALKKLFNESVEKSSTEELGNTVLHQLLKQEEEYGKLTLKQVMDNAMIMFGAGYETTAITISHVILLLAMHPEVDKKLFSEIQENYKDGQSVDYVLIKKLNYLDMVLKEVLRFLPTAPVLLRQCVEDKYIDGIGTITKGSIVIPLVYSIHRSKTYWGPDADKFNPDNFLPENISKRHPFCYLPFSMGPRNCIGLEYAQINLKMALVHIFSKFRFETELKIQDLEVSLTVFLRLKNEYVVKVHHR